MTRDRTPPLIRILPLSALLFAVALFVGCGDNSGAHDDHDGHDHAGHDHSGHAHGADDDGATAAAILAAHAHEGPDETCFMCDPSKREAGRLWCNEHVRYENRCWVCHPEIEDKGRLYCEEHFLYEDECHVCHPELKEGGEAAAGHDHDEHDGGAVVEAASHDGHDHGEGAAHGMRDGRLFCNEHGLFEDECGICQPGLAGSLRPGENLKVRFPSSASAEKAGVRVGLPGAAQSVPSIEALCEVQYNLNEMARVTPLAGGVIRTVRHDVGEVVEADDVLVELHSAQAAAAKSDYLAALVRRDIGRQAMERQARLREQNIAAEKDLLDAQALQRSTDLQANHHRQRLANLGFTDGEIEEIERDQDTSARLFVRAPFAGTIVERNAVVGEAVDTGVSVFTVADLSSRWLMLSVPSRHLAALRKGQVVTAGFEELPGVEVRGEITWIDASIDPRSRMVKARAVVTDETDRIKTGLFGKARVVVGAARPATVVPREAVQRHDGGTFVFVRDASDLFSLRRVALGRSDAHSAEVLAGLSAGDAVVTDGSFVVMSEFLKSRLGAGCADH